MNDTLQRRSKMATTQLSFANHNMERSRVENEDLKQVLFKQEKVIAD